MTIPARHIRVRSTEFEPRPVVVEGSRLPLTGGMTDGAIGRLGFIRELPAVNIFMAPGARGRRFPKDYQSEAGRERAGAVALVARGGAVRSGQRKPGGIVVELGHVAPGLVGVARLAPVGSHSCLELTLVRVNVAAGAGKIRKLVCHGHGMFGPLGVALVAGDGQVCAAQRETRLVVAGQSDFRGMKSIHGVAALAAIAGELALVRVLVTIRAE